MKKAKTTTTTPTPTPIIDETVLVAELKQLTDRLIAAIQAAFEDAMKKAEEKVQAMELKYSDE